MASLSPQELQQKRAQKASETKHSAEELVLVKESRRVPKKKPGAKPASARNVSPAGSLTKANNAGESLWHVPRALGVRGRRGQGAVCSEELLPRSESLRTVWFLQRPIPPWQPGSWKEAPWELLAPCRRQTPEQRTNCRWVWLCLLGALAAAALPGQHQSIAGFWGDPEKSLSSSPLGCELQGDR